MAFVHRDEAVDQGHGGHAGLQHMTQLRQLVSKMVGQRRAENVVVSPRHLKTHWRPEGHLREREPKRRKPRLTQVVLPPVEDAEEEFKELTEFDFLDGGKSKDAGWRGPDRPMNDVWGDRWTELRYLWERLRAAFKETALVTAKQVRGAGDR